jgi:16S rRNA (uracil1498-N3)-methyltransferase
MHRFFLTDTPIQTSHSVDLTPLARQLHTVLRLRPGSRIVLLNGQGDEFLVEMHAIDGRRAQGWVVEQQPGAGEPGIRLALYPCALKGDKFEWVLQKGAELGVSSFTPVISQHSVVSPAAALLKKYERWRTILREAAEQCGRSRLPELARPLAWQEAVVQASGMRFLAWEAAQERPGLQKAIAAALAQNPGDGHIFSLLIGPEGGLTIQEVEAAESAGWQMVSLGRRILRAETAALAAVTIVMAQAGELG